MQILTNLRYLPVKLMISQQRLLTKIYSCYRNESYGALRRSTTLTGCPLAFLSITVTMTSTSTPSNSTRWGVSQKAALSGVSKSNIASAICGRISSRAADWAQGLRHRDLGKVDLMLRGQPFSSRFTVRVLAIASDWIRVTTLINRISDTSVDSKITPRRHAANKRTFLKMAGAHRLELWAYGFGDRRSTN